jgi:UDP-N-acetylmuramoyl-L-alanyl-D-glutamate--2,6-diaminopimelate ligase
MGAEVARGADLAVVTSDNPRSEDPLAIIEAILPGLEGQGWRQSPPDGMPEREAFAVIPDRRQAIECAVRLAAEQDVVLIAGKGHETYQQVGSKRHHFDDREEARQVLMNGAVQP